MNIVKIIAREIYDSRGIPTVECDVILKNGMRARAAVPSGASCSAYEAYEMRDEDVRVVGKGVMKAVQNIEKMIAPAFVGKHPDVISMDVQMIEMDATYDKSTLGANAMLAVSMALCKAQAMVEEIELYELIAYLCDFKSVSIPGPMFNIINGGVHTNNNLVIQEFMVLPIGMSSFRSAMELSTSVYQTLKKLLQEAGKSIAVGDEGGFAPNFKDELEALDYIMMAIKKTEAAYEGTMMIALDVAASQIYNKKSRSYRWRDKKIQSQELIEWYHMLLERYPIYSIEDGLAEDDIEGWGSMFKRLSGSTQIVGDDLFATNAERIQMSLKKKLANTVVIKPNQIGTVTETLQAIKLCQDNSLKTIVSHRSGETNDSFIADLAIGVSADHIKAGGCSRGERMAKYNRLLRVEDSLVLDSF